MLSQKRQDDIQAQYQAMEDHYELMVSEKIFTPPDQMAQVNVHNLPMHESDCTYVLTSLLRASSTRA